MKKLKLNLETVEVQSFATANVGALMGTVHALAPTYTLCGATCRGPSCCQTEWEPERGG